MKKWIGVFSIAAGAAGLFAACGPGSADACGADTDCKGDRICVDGECVSPTDNGNPNADTNSDTNTNPNSSPNSDSNSNTTATINGQPPDEYYGQFHWEETTSYVSGAAAFETQEDGRNAFLTHVFLYEDGSATVFYEEGEGDVTLTGHSLSTFTDTQTRIDTTWTIDTTDLVIGDVFTCSGIEFNDESILSCTLERTIVTDAAVGSNARLDTGFSEASPDDTQFADYTSE